jgi:hypothetical protein
MHTIMPPAPPLDVFATWGRAQLELDRHSRESPRSAHRLRTTGFLRPELAEWVTEWFTDAPAPPDEAVLRSYAALARETGRLYEAVRHCLGVRVTFVRSADEPYDSAAALCAELRERGTMTLACDDPHPLLGDRFDELRVVHDVFGHAALGLGFDLQSEFATWLQCRTLFSGAARPAAFCELVGAVTAYIVTGAKPGLQAKLPPAGLLAACEF